MNLKLWEIQIIIMSDNKMFKKKESQLFRVRNHKIKKKNFRTPRPPPSPKSPIQKNRKGIYKVEVIRDKF